MRFPLQSCESSVACWFVSLSSLFVPLHLSFLDFKMVAFEEPEISKVPNPSDPKNETIWDSPPETAVNTAAPSQAPSIHGSNEDRDLENSINTEKVLSRAQQVLACADPVTHIVDWDGEDDPANPMNFPRSKKWVMTMSLAAITFCVSFSSSVFSTATTVTAEEFGISLEVMILGVSLYVLGFACGRFHIPVRKDEANRNRPLGLGTALRSVWSYTPSLHWFHNLHSLSNTRSCGTECRNDNDLPLLCWLLRSSSNCHSRRNVRRFLERPGSRDCHSWLRRRNIPWSDRRTNCRRVHNEKLSRLAMDCLDNSDCFSRLRNHWIVHRAGNISTYYLEEES